jgi:hypothetical protein
MRRVLLVEKKKKKKWVGSGSVIRKDVGGPGCSGSVGNESQCCGLDGIFGWRVEFSGTVAGQRLASLIGCSGQLRLAGRLNRAQTYVR